MAKPHQWKHGWIPLTEEAAKEKFHGHVPEGRSPSSKADKEATFRRMMSGESPAYKPESEASKSKASAAARKSAGLEGSKLTGKTRRAHGTTQHEVLLPDGKKQWADEGSQLHGIAARAASKGKQRYISPTAYQNAKKALGGSAGASMSKFDAARIVKEYEARQRELSKPAHRRGKG